MATVQILRRRDLSVLELLHRSPLRFASAQLVREMRNRQLKSLYFSGAFEPQ
jgi:hypothetical protein